VRHIDQQQRSTGISDGAHSLKVKDARICAPSPDNELWFFAHRDLLKIVVVDSFRILAHSVGDDLVQLAGEIQFVAVREMPAMGKVESQNGILRLQYGGIGGGIGLRSRVWLHIYMFSVKELFGALASEILDYICEFTSAVIALAGIAFCVFVCEYASGSFQHRFADEIL